MATVSYPSFLVAVLAVALALHVVRKWRKDRGEASLPPGPRGLPLLGSLPFLRPDLHRYFADLARTHGPVMHLRLGGKLWIVLTSPDALKEVVKVHDAVFANHDVPAVALDYYGGKDIVWTPYGPRWRVLRKVAVREVLSAATIDGLYSIRQREMGRMVDEVRRRAREPVEVRELVFATALNAMTMMLWGGTVAEDEEERKAVSREFRQAVDAVMELLGLPNVSDFFPALAWLDLQGLSRRMRRVVAWVDRIFNSVIDQRLRSMEGRGSMDGAAAEESRDFLQVLMEVLQSGDLETPLTMENAKALLLDLVVGGTDTTSTTVEWAMAELLSNPKMMMKAKEEIAAVVGKENKVEESHLPRLHYLDAIVKEVLRLHPVLPLLVPRRPTSSSTIAGYRIPEGSKVVINAWAIQRDPQFWEDASRFEPERFLGTRWKAEYNGNNFHYLPFGFGRRICAGISLGERMVKHMLASLLHTADWTLPEGVQADLSEMIGVIMKKERALVAVPTLP